MIFVELLPRHHLTRARPTVIKVSGVHFLKLAVNKASGPTLYLTGKLRLWGDVMLASRLTSSFSIPSAG